MKNNKLTSAKLDSSLPAVTNQTQKSETNFPIVGIGASAGGLEALEQFFSNMPKDTGMAFVVIQHLDPNHVGIMPELLQRITPMKVSQATDSLRVKQNCVYVIPPNKSMSILNAVLHLFEPIETRGLRLPIDVFFRSLADDRQERSIGIILSGMGSDGSLGIKAIKEKNGIVLVQSAESAKFDGMPRSAAEAVIADIVAPADELPAKLLEFLRYIPKVKEDIELDDKYKSNLDKIIILLREQTSHDFSMYKKNTLFRRIERRKSVHQIEKISNYVRFLQENTKEIDILFKELLIGVTSFFRDTAVWENLKEKTLPALMNNLPNGYMLRAWVTGCSTGEEAYTLAIIFKEVQETHFKNKNLTLQIFATDLDIDAIERARKGVFPANIITDVTAERISRFFINEDGGYRLNSAIREMVVFAHQNVIKDPPFTKLDILTCRNMLIYLEQDLQTKLMALFNYSLNSDGIMILGTAETLGNAKDGFIELDSRLKIYKRIAKTLSSELLDFPSSFNRFKSVQSDIKTSPKTTENIQNIAEQIMLQRFAPASVMVNDKGDILYITGRTGKYLEPAAGKTNVNIHAMAREGLRDVLPNAFRKAMLNFDAQILRNIKIGTNGGTQYVDVTVQRIENPGALRNMIIVVFTDVDHIIPQEQINSKTGKLSSSGRHKELEKELQRSYEDMQGIREEMQTSQEELKSTNEELQSTNEELQSTNEELTTSKEEMQSLNDELQTVNVEVQSKINDYGQASNDMKNLLNSTEIATLFLDKGLNIRRFTDSIVNIFKLRSVDIGRPFTDMVSDLQYPDIENHCLLVLKTLTTIETPINTNDGRWFTVRIMPYRTLDDRIDGLVITFTDMTIAKKAEAALKESEHKYSTIFEQSPIAIEFYNSDGVLINVNSACINLFGVVNSNEILGFKLFEDPNIPDEIKIRLKNNENVRFEAEFDFEEVKRLNLYKTTCSGVKILDWSITPMMNNDLLIGYIEQIQDITEGKQTKDELRTKAEQNQTIIKIALDGFWLMDKQGQLLEVNDAYCQMSGYTVQELLTLNITDLSSSMVSVVNERLQNFDAQRFESQHRRKDGSLYDIEVSVQYLPIGGVFAAFARDISDRKTAPSP